MKSVKVCKGRPPSFWWASLCGATLDITGPLAEALGMDKATAGTLFFVPEGEEIVLCREATLDPTWHGDGDIGFGGGPGHGPVVTIREPGHYYLLVTRESEPEKPPVRVMRYCRGAGLWDYRCGRCGHLIPSPGACPDCSLCGGLLDWMAPLEMSDLRDPSGKPLDPEAGEARGQG